MRGLDPQAAAPSSCAATCATAAAWPAACAACRAAPLRSLAAAFAGPAAVRAWDIVISPRAQARACSIAWRGRGPQARADSKRSRTCSAHDARPQGVELVIRIGEGPTAADRYETRAAVFRQDHTAHLLLASVQHVTHAPRVSNRQARARPERTTATSALHRGTDRAAPRADRRSRLLGAVRYSWGGSPRAAVVAAVGATQANNGECGRRRRAQASARLIACEPSTCSAPQPDG